jgi:hypothetical protein
MLCWVKTGQGLANIQLFICASIELETTAMQTTKYPKPAFFNLPKNMKDVHNLKFGPKLKSTLEGKIFFTR